MLVNALWCWVAALLGTVQIGTSKWWRQQAHWTGWQDFFLCIQHVSCISLRWIFTSPAPLKALANACVLHFHEVHLHRLCMPCRAIAHEFEQTISFTKDKDIVAISFCSLEPQEPYLNIWKSLVHVIYIKKDHVIYRWRTASPLFFCDVGRISSTHKNTPSIASKCKIGSTCVGRRLCLELYRRCTLIWAHTTHRVHSVHLWETAFSHTWTNKLCNRSLNTPASQVRWTILLNIINSRCRWHYEPFHSGWQCLWNQITLVLTSTSLKISMSYNV